MCAETAVQGQNHRFGENAAASPVGFFAEGNANCRGGGRAAEPAGRLFLALLPRVGLSAPAEDNGTTRIRRSEVETRAQPAGSGEICPPSPG